MEAMVISVFGQVLCWGSFDVWSISCVHKGGHTSVEIQAKSGEHAFGQY